MAAPCVDEVEPDPAASARAGTETVYFTGDDKWPFAVRRGGPETRATSKAVQFAHMRRYWDKPERGAARSFICSATRVRSGKCGPNCKVDAIVAETARKRESEIIRRLEPTFRLMCVDGCMTVFAADEAYTEEYLKQLCDRAAALKVSLGLLTLLPKSWSTVHRISTIAVLSKGNGYMSAWGPKRSLRLMLAKLECVSPLPSDGARSQWASAESNTNSCLQLKLIRWRLRARRFRPRSSLG